MTQAPAQVRVAALQLNSQPDPDHNFAQFEPLVHQAAAEGAAAVQLPEGCITLGDGDVRQAVAEPLPEGGPLLRRLCTLARAAGVELQVGGFPERLPVTDDRHGTHTGNTAILIDRSGAVIHCYRKLHLFDVDLADGTRLQESATTAAGDALALVPSVLGTLGLTICYDLRFPVLYERLAAAGANVLAVPAAFTRGTGPDHWEVLLRARAIETQCWVIAAAQWGRHHAANGSVRESFGQTLVVDPWGTVVARRARGVGIVPALIDHGLTESIRRELPVHTHRRTLSMPG